MRREKRSPQRSGARPCEPGSPGRAPCCVARRVVGGSGQAEGPSPTAPRTAARRDACLPRCQRPPGPPPTPIPGTPARRASGCSRAAGPGRPAWRRTGKAVAAASAPPRPAPAGSSHAAQLRSGRMTGMRAWAVTPAALSSGSVYGSRALGSSPLLLTKGARRRAHAYLLGVEASPTLRLTSRSRLSWATRVGRLITFWENIRT